MPLLAAAAGLVVLLFVGLLQAGRVLGARLLGGALGTPVSVGALWWAPWNGQLVIDWIAIGEGDARITIRRIATVLDILRLSPGAIVLDRVEVDAPAGLVQVDDEYRVTIGALGGGSADTAAAPPHITVRELVVDEGKLVVRHPVGVATRDAMLNIERFVASGVEMAPAPDGARFALDGELRGTWDGAPVQGTVQLRAAGADTAVSGELAVSGLLVDRDVAPLPAGMETLRATIDATVTLQLGGGAAPEIAAKVRVVAPRLVLGGATSVSARAIALPEVRIKPGAARVDLGPVTIEGVETVIAVGGGGGPAAAARATTEAGGWTIASGPIEIRGGQVALRRGAETLPLELERVRWDGLRPGGTATRPARSRGAPHLAATVRVAEGTVAIDGTLATAPPVADLTVRLDQIALAPATAFAATLPVAIAKGTASGEVRLTVGGERGSRLGGTLRIRDLHTAPPDPQFPTEVIAWHEADADFSVTADAPPAVDIARLNLRYPYVLLQRRHAGLFPYTLVATDGEGEPPDAVTGRPGLALRIGRLEATGGKIEFVDSTVEPIFWTSLTDVAVEAEDIAPASASIRSFALAGKQDELSPVAISGTLDARGFAARVAMTDVLLESLNTYIAPLLGYRLVSGRLSIELTATPEPPLLASNARVVLRDVDVHQTGIDVVREQSGVPLPIALGLIANADGDIRLTLPLTIDPSARSVTIGSVIWQAVRSALVTAVSAPVRLLGSLFGKDSAPHAFAIDPIPFAGGSGTLDEAGRARVAAIARILAAHRTLAIVLMPQLTDADVAAVGSDGAAALAAARMRAVQDALADGTAAPALDPRRMLPVDWTPAIGARATGRSGVYAELQDGHWAVRPE